MPDWLNIHEPVLVNTNRHRAGVVIFGMLLYLLLINRLRSRDDRSRLAVRAAGLAILWIMGSLVALATGPVGGIAANIIVAASFSVLSLLPGGIAAHLSRIARPRGMVERLYL